MIITWLGHSYFKIESRGKIIAIDPYSESSTGFKPPRFKADILLISHQHEEHNNKKAILGEPFILEGPGEIEIGGIFIEGLLSFHDKKRGKARGLNTIYLINSEDINIAFLGDLGESHLKDETLEKINNPDILLIPVGGRYTIDAEEAVFLINQIEPKIVIPMHYSLQGLKIKLDPVEKFVKALGKKPEILDKLTIRKNQLPENTNLIILRPQIRLNKNE